MRKIGLAILAAAAVLASCTKMDVAYENETEIGFAPVPKNVTKVGAMPDGDENPATTTPLPIDEKLGIFAYWHKTENPTTTPSYNTRETYLENAEFIHKTELSAWCGTTAYPWPLNGSLVFAGYNIPTGAGITPASNGTTWGSATYTLADNTMTFNYTQSTDVDNTFDLCWFGRTSQSYNNRTNGNAISVTLNHTLSWIDFKIQGEGSALTSWKVTKLELLSLGTKSIGTCNTSSISWTDPDESTKANMIVFNNSVGQAIYNNPTAIGSENGIVVIPQTPVYLKVYYKYLKPQTTDQYIEEYTSVLLALDNQNTTKWEAGKHYTYTLNFKANEILIDPSYGDWTTGSQSVTVE